MVEVGGKLVEQFAANLAKLIAGDTGSAVSGGDAGSGDAGSSAPAGTSDTGTSDTGASVSGAGADGASAPAGTAGARTGNGSSGAAVSAAAGAVASTSAPAQHDSLNLVKLVGPAILKRLVPVVVGAASLALLSLAALAAAAPGGAGREGLAEGRADGGLHRGRTASAHGAPVLRRARLGGEPGPDLG